MGSHVFAGCALLYAFAVLLASASPGPRAWGLHLAGFLDPPARLLIFTLLGIGVAASLAAAFGRPVAQPEPAPEGETIPQGPSVEPGTRRRARSVGFRVALLGAFAAVLWLLRTRTHFLGDGMIWLYGLREGDLSAPTEPLAQAIWLWASGALRELGAPVLSPTLAIVSIACGVLAAALFWGIAREITFGREGFIPALLLLLTLGTSQLFFGYIESYPPAAVAILAYLFAGLRYLRREREVFLVVLAFAVAVASHLIALYLLPSLVVLVARARLSRLRRAGLIGLAVALSTAFLILFGSGPVQWVHAFDLATRAARVGPAASTVKPYEILSPGHAVDIANAILLVAPVPLFLLLARVAERRGLGLRSDPTGLFLGTAAGAGLLGSIALVLPVAPAQDWDLISLLLLPLGVLGVWAGQPLYASRGKGMQIGAVSIGLGALLCFVLVNATPGAGTRRYETLIGPRARITDFARWYGYELLAHYHRHRGDYLRAMTYVDRLLETEPANPRYWAMGGATLVGMGRYAEAIPYLVDALRRSPNRAGTRTNLGICYSALGRYREALREFQVAARIDGTRPDYLHNLGLAYRNVGEPDSARAIWTEVLHRWPGYRPTARAMAKYFGLGSAAE